MRKRVEHLHKWWFTRLRFGLVFAEHVGQVENLPHDEHSQVLNEQIVHGLWQPRSENNPATKADPTPFIASLRRSAPAIWNSCRLNNSLNIS